MRLAIENVAKSVPSRNHARMQSHAIPEGDAEIVGARTRRRG